MNLSQDKISGILDILKDANQKNAAIYPGDSGERQPVHTVYGGAHLFKSDSAVKLGEVAVRALNENAPDSAAFARALDIPDFLADTVYSRVSEKIKREAVEDFRIDFEDGYGNRPDEEEDAQARIAAEETAKGMKNGTLPPFIGIRIKPFTEELKLRSIKTLDIYVSTLAAASGGKLPDNFIVTLPKITSSEQVSALVSLFEILERTAGLKTGSLKIELMIETTQSIINRNGYSNMPIFVAASGGRCRGAHFGTYDYTASCDITAAHQSMVHPACDFARHVMKVTLAGTGIMLSDGATNVMPVGPHRAPSGGSLTPAQIGENKEVVHRAWKLAYDHIQHSLINAFYQGWDLHPAQFPIRYAALYTFFLKGLEQASIRLKTFIEKAAQATLVGDVFDDAATGQGLLNYFLRALNCGAITEKEIKATGLTLAEFRARSFVKILETRRKR